MFAVIFGELSLWHLHQSKQEMPGFELEQRPLQRVDSPMQIEVGFAGSAADEPLKIFVKDFNAYLENSNAASRSVNCRAAWGFLAACLTAIAGIIVECRENISGWLKGRHRRTIGQPKSEGDEKPAS